jgi:hypothetical protein
LENVVICITKNVANCVKPGRIFFGGGFMKKYFKTKVAALALSAVILVPTVASAAADYGCNVVRNSIGYLSAWGWTTYSGHKCRVRIVVSGAVLDQTANNSISGSAEAFASTAYHNHYIDGNLIASGSN